MSETIGGVATAAGTGGGVEVLRATLAALETGKPLRSERLWIFPLQLPAGRTGTGGAAAAPPLLLCDALGQGVAEVTEIGVGGSVPRLAIRNLAPLPILVPEGEVLVGAKQNRVANLTLLVPPLCEFLLPVSCVEAGRWSARTARFSAGGWANPKVRRAKVASVWEAKAMAGAGVAAERLYSDQSRVWCEVAACAEDLRVVNGTSDLDASIKAARTRYAERAAAAPPELPAGTVGVAAVAAGEMLGIDLWAAEEHLAQVWPRMWEAYLVDALRAPEQAEFPSRRAVLGLLQRVSRAARPVESDGLGESLEIAGRGVAGTALVWQGQVQHLAAFAM